jgi:hypothetical protein
MGTIGRLIWRRRHVLAAAIVLGAVDVATTIIGLSYLPSIMGEANPLGRELWSTAGPGGLVAIKALTIVGFLAVLLLADWMARVEADRIYARVGHLFAAGVLGFWTVLAVSNTETIAAVLPWGPITRAVAALHA